MSGKVRRQDAGEARREHGKAWLTTLAIGVVIIVVTNLAGIGPWWVALALSALMVAFGVSVRDTEVSSDSKGESFYYVGLIFTFVALVAALVVFDGGSDANRTIGIIRNFGIALVTTIWGLAGRVWYAMSGDAPGDLEEAIRGDLEEAVSEMKGSLDRARDQLDILVRYLRGVRQGHGGYHQQNLRHRRQGRTDDRHPGRIGEQGCRNRRIARRECERLQRGRRGRREGGAQPA